MKRVVTGFVVALFVVAGMTVIGFAADKKQATKATKSAPVQLTQQQMDQVTAGSASGSDYHSINGQKGSNYVGDNTSNNDYKRAGGSDKTYICDPCG